MILANDTQQLFGTIKPPIGGPSDPGTGLSQLLVGGIRLALFFGGILLLGYLFYGAFLYISSGGDEEKVSAARKTMTYAIVGVVLLVVGLSIFSVVAGDVLGIIKRDAQGNIYFNLPTVGGTTPEECPPGEACP